MIAEYLIKVNLPVIAALLIAVQALVIINAVLVGYWIGKRRDDIQIFPERKTETPVEYEDDYYSSAIPDYGERTISTL